MLAAPLFAPHASGLHNFPIRPLVNSTRNDGEDLLQPAGAAPHLFA